ncbi:MAG: hypothetical protein M1542_08380 [Thermotogae bacterium]|jgi:hypothetical protein|nr:hypothetical protein [Thermotogota bacterium]
MPNEKLVIYLMRIELTVSDFDLLRRTMKANILANMNLPTACFMNTLKGTIQRKKEVIKATKVMIQLGYTILVISFLDLIRHG